MLSMSSVSGLLLLALVLYEVQNAARAVIFAVDCPADVRIGHTREGARSIVGAPPTGKTRAALTWRRMAYCSVLLHELYSWHIGQAPVFKAGPSVLFGAMAAAMGLMLGLPESSAGSLAVISAAVLFGSSQARSIIHFHALLTASDEQVNALIKSL